MNEENPETKHAAKKVRHIASIIYLLVFAFLIGGTYYNQQQKPNANEEILSE